MSDTDQPKGKSFPSLKSDEEAERFVDTADLSEYDFSDFKPARFELRTKEKQLNLRISEAQLEALKAAAKRDGIPYTRLARHMIEQGLKHMAP